MIEIFKRKEALAKEYASNDVNCDFSNLLGTYLQDAYLAGFNAGFGRAISIAVPKISPSNGIMPVPTDCQECGEKGQPIQPCPPEE